MAFRWNDLLKQPTTVVPAKAGTHYVCRSNPQGAIGSSLRSDGVRWVIRSCGLKAAHIQGEELSIAQQFRHSDV
jgi:hypothetical protein